MAGRPRGLRRPHGGGVLRTSTRTTETFVAPVGPVEVSDDHHEGAEALFLQRGGEPDQGVEAGLLERRSQREVLDGIAGEHHLRERRDASARASGLVTAGDDERDVAVEVADAGVDLGEREAQLGHLPTLQTRTKGRPGAMGEPDSHARAS